MGNQTERIPLRRAVIESGLSDSTLRRALRDPADPLPHLRIGLGDPQHARILIRRDDLERWLQRRSASLAIPVRDVVDEIVGKLRGGGA